MNNLNNKIPEDTFLREDLLNIANCDYIKKLPQPFDVKYDGRLEIVEA